MAAATKRVREVHSVDMVAHLWAHQSQDSARNGGRDNFFFRGDTIYSYGTHFPIAKHVKNKRGEFAVLFTTATYSVTTMGHCNVVRGAIRGQTVFNVSYLTDPDHTANMADYGKRIVDAALAAAKARSSKEFKLRELEALVAEANAYSAFFGQRKRFTIPSDFDLAAAKEMAAEWTRKQAEQKRKDSAKRAAALAQRQADALIAAQRWIAGENVQRWELAHAEGTFLRLSPSDPETVETSRGAEFPLAHAKRILPAVRSGVPYAHNGHTIHAGAFRIDAIDADGNVRAGCHYVTRAEVERFAATLGW